MNEHKLIVSASDDRSCLLWDRRQKRPTATLSTEFPILAVAGSQEHQQIYTAGIDPKIYAWDARRTQHPVYSMSGHTDTVTSLAIRPGGDDTHILSNSMDQTLRSWDIRPFCGHKRRHDKTFVGHAHSAEKGLLKCSWSADGGMLAAGSSDHRVHIWDELSAVELYDLPGHTGCVNAVAFHPTEKTVIASGSSDKQIYVGELS
jgi:Prp8 binding protein